MQSSKWKEKFNNLLAGVVLPVVAERPVNAFIIQNPDAVNIIYAGPENNTSATNYETYIAPGQWGVIARPFSFDSIFLFSAGAVNRVKIVEAIVDDPLALASRNIGGSSQEVFVTSTVGLTAAQLNIEAVTRNLQVKEVGRSVALIYGPFAVGAAAVDRAITNRLCTVNVLSGNCWINPNAAAVADATAIKLALSTGNILDLVVAGNLSLISDATGASVQIIVWA